MMSLATLDLGHGYKRTLETHSDGTVTRTDFYPNGSIDEIVTRQLVHIEQMNENCIWMGIAAHHYHFTSAVRWAGWKWWEEDGLARVWWKPWLMWRVMVRLKLTWSDTPDDPNDE